MTVSQIYRAWGMLRGKQGRDSLWRAYNGTAPGTREPFAVEMQAQQRYQWVVRLSGPGCVSLGQLKWEKG